MLEQVLMYLNNFFVTEIYQGTCVIENGSIELSFLQPGQYFRIVGSIFNDGVYKYGDELELADETFEGAIWALAVPPAVIKLAEEIEKWDEQYGDTMNSPYTSESFGGYSYSKGSGSDGTGADAGDWRSVFKTRLAPYRKKRETAPVNAPGYQDPPYAKPFNPAFPWGL